MRVNLIKFGLFFFKPDKEKLFQNNLKMSAEKFTGSTSTRSSLVEYRACWKSKAV